MIVKIRKPVLIRSKSLIFLKAKFMVYYFVDIINNLCKFSTGNYIMMVQAYINLLIANLYQPQIYDNPLKILLPLENG
jgi:hypothetical protein